MQTFAALNPVAIALMATDVIAALSTDQVAALTTAQIAAMTTAQLPALGTTNAHLLTSPQVNALNNAQIASLTVGQIAVLPIADLAALTSTAGVGLTASQLAALGTNIPSLSSEAISTLGSGQLAGLTAAQLHALSPTQFGAINSSALSGLTAGQVATLGASQLGGLSNGQLVSLSTAAVSGLTSTQLAGLSTPQLALLSSTQVGSLNTDAIANLTVTQVGALNSAQIYALGTKIANLPSADIQSLTSAQATGLSSTELAALTDTQVAALSTSALAVLNAIQADGLTSADVTALGTKILALTSQAMSSLNAAQVAGLTLAQIPTLSTAQVSALSPAALAGLTNSQTLVLSSSQLAALTASQFSAMSPAQISTFPTSVFASLTPAQMSGLNSAQIAALATDQVAAIHAATFGVLSASQAGGLNAAQIAHLTTAQAHVLSSSVMGALTTAQFGALTSTQLAQIPAASFAALPSGLVATIASNQVAGLTSDQLSTLGSTQLYALTDGVIASLGSDQAAGLSSTQLNKLRVDQIDSLSTAAIAVLTSQQTAGLTSGQLVTLTNAQLAALTSSGLSGLSSTQVDVLQPSQFGVIATSAIAGLSTAVISSLTTPQVAGFSSAQLHALTPAQVAAINYTALATLSADQVHGLDATQLAALSPLQVQSLSLTALSALDSTQVAAITSKLASAQTRALQDIAIGQTTVIGGSTPLTSDALAALSPATVSALTPTQLQSLTTTQAQGLGSAQVASLGSAQLAALSTDVVASLGSAQVAGLTSSQINTLTTSQVVALPTDVFASLTSTQVNGLSSSQVQGLTLPLVQALSTADIRSLTASQAAGLTSGQLAVLSSDQVASLSTQALSVLTGTQAAGLNSSQVSALTTAQVASLSSAAMAGLTSDQLPGLNSQQIASLTPTQFDALGASALGSVTSAQIRGVTPVQLAGLGSDQLNALSTSAFGGLSSSQVSGLTTAQVSTMTVGDLASLSPQAVSNLSSGQVNAMTATQVQNLTTTQLGALSSQAVAGLGVTQVAGLTTTQLAALSSTSVGGLSTQSVAALGTTADGLTPQQISVLNTAQVNALTTAALAGLSSAQVGSLTTTQLATMPAGASVGLGALTTTSMAGLTADQTASLSTTQLSGLTSAQVRAIPVTALGGLDSTQIAALQGVTTLAAPQTAALSDIAYGQALTSATLAALSSTDIAALSPATISSISNAAWAGLTTLQMTALSSDQVGVMRTGQLAALSLADLATLSSTQASGMTSTQVSSLSSTQIAVLSTSAIAGLTSSQFAGLTSTQLTTLSTAQVSALSASATAALSSTQIDGMSMGQVAALQTSQVSVLATYAIASLNSIQLGAMTTTQLAAMSSSQVQAIDPFALAGLTSAQSAIINSMMSPTQQTAVSSINTVRNTSSANIPTLSSTALAGLSPVAISLLSTAQIAALNSNQMLALSSAQLAVLNSNQMAALTTADLAALNSTQIAGFSSAQIASLSSAQLAALNTSASAALTSIQVGGLTSVTLHALTPAQVASLVFDGVATLGATQIPGLTAEQLAAMSTAQVSALTTSALNALTGVQAKGFTSAQLQAMSASQIAALGTSAIAALGSAQMAGMTSDQLSALSPSQVAVLSSSAVSGLSASQIAGFGSVQLASLSSAQAAVMNTAALGAMSAAQAAGLTSGQLDAMSSTQLDALTPAVIRVLTSNQLGGLTAAQVGSLTVAQVAALDPSAMAGLSADQLAGLTVGQINALLQSQVQALSSTALSGLSAAQLAAITPNLSVSQQAALVDVAAGQAYTPSQVQALSAVAFAALSPTTLSALSTSAVAVVSASQLDALSPTQLAALRNSQLAVIAPAAIASLTGTQINAFNGAQMAGLTTSQLAALPVSLVAALGSTQVAGLPPADISILSTGQIAAVTPNVLANLSVVQFNAVTTGQIAALTTAQLSAMPTQLLSNFSTQQISALTSAQLGSLSPLQTSSWSNAQLGSLSAAQMALLNPSTQKLILDTQGSTLNQFKLYAVTPIAPMTVAISPVDGNDLVTAQQKQAGVVVNGTATGASTVQVTWGTVTQTAKVNDIGVWSVQFSASQLPADGSVAVTATPVNLAGVSGASSTTATRTVTLGTVVPTAPVITSITGIGNSDPQIDSTEAAAGITISGTAQSSRQIVVRWGNQTRTVTTASNSTAWSVTFNSASVPKDGITQLTATASDAVGNAASLVTNVWVNVAGASLVNSLMLMTHNATNNLTANTTGASDSATTVPPSFISTDGKFAYFAVLDSSKFGNATGGAFTDSITTTGAGAYDLLSFNIATGQLKLVNHLGSSATTTTGIDGVTTLATLQSVVMTPNQKVGGNTIALSMADVSVFGFTDSSATNKDIVLFNPTTGNYTLVSHAMSGANASTTSNGVDNVLAGLAGNSKYVVIGVNDASQYGYTYSNAVTTFTDTSTTTNAGRDLVLYDVSTGNYELITHTSAVTNGKYTTSNTVAPTSILPTVVGSSVNGKYIYFTYQDINNLGNKFGTTAVGFGTSAHGNYGQYYPNANDLLSYNTATGQINLVDHSYNTSSGTYYYSYNTGGAPGLVATSADERFALVNIGAASGSGSSWGNYIGGTYYYNSSSYYNTTDIVLYDNFSGTLRVVNHNNVPSLTAGADFGSFYSTQSGATVSATAAMSFTPDSKYVIFTAANAAAMGNSTLFVDASTTSTDIVAYNVGTQQLSLVTHSSAANNQASALTDSGATLNGISADSQYIVFSASNAAQLGNAGVPFSDASPGTPNLFVYNLLTGATAVISHNAAQTGGVYTTTAGATGGTTGSTFNALTADGKYVIFSANNASKFGTSGTYFTDAGAAANDIFSYELSTGTIRLVTHDATVGNLSSSALYSSNYAGISGDGRYVFFTQQDATKLGNAGSAFLDDQARKINLFAYDLSTGEQRLLDTSATTLNTAGSGDTVTYQGSSADGNFAIFSVANTGTLGSINSGTGTAFTATGTQLILARLNLLDLASASDTGSSATDNLTNSTSLNLTAAVSPNQTVKVVDSYFNGTSTVTTTLATVYTADANGTVAINSLAAAAGRHTFSLIDATSNSPLTLAYGIDSGAKLVVNVNTTTPTTPTISTIATDDKVNNVEKAAGVAITGTAPANSTVQVTWAGAAAPTTIADASGNWRVFFQQAQIPVDAASSVVTAVATDAAGNVSQAGSKTIAVTTVAPTTPSLTQLAGSTFATNQVVTSTSGGVTVSGTGTTGTTITVNWGGNTKTATAANSAWSVTFSAQEAPSEGGTPITVKATDSIGNVSSVGTYQAIVNTSGSVWAGDYTLVTHTGTYTSASGNLQAGYRTANAVLYTFPYTAYYGPTTGTWYNNPSYLSYANTNNLLALQIADPSIYGNSVNGTATPFANSESSTLAATITALGSAANNGSATYLPSSIVLYNQATQLFQLVNHTGAANYRNTATTDATYARGFTADGSYYLFQKMDVTQLGNYLNSTATAFTRTGTASTTNTTADIFAYNTTTGDLSLVTHSSVAGGMNSAATTSNYVSTSADGRYVIFNGAAAQYGNNVNGTALNFSAAASSGINDYFAYNLATGQTKMLTHGASSAYASLTTSSVTYNGLTGDGRFAVFSYADLSKLGNSNGLFTDAFAGVTDIVIANLSTGKQSLVTHSSLSSNADSGSSTANSTYTSVSPDGKFVLFSNNNASSFGNNLVNFSDSSITTADSFVYNVDTGKLQLVTHSSATGNSTSSAMAASTLTWSGNGRYLAFLANNAGAFGNDGTGFVDATPSVNDIMVYDTTTGQLSLASHNANVGNLSSSLVSAVRAPTSQYDTTTPAPTFTADGKYLVFAVNDVTQLGNNGTLDTQAAPVAQLMAYSTATGEVKLVTHSATAQTDSLVTNTTTLNALTPDGQYVIFSNDNATQFGNISGSTHTAFTDANPYNNSDLFAYNLANGTIDLITHSALPGRTDSAHLNGVTYNGITADGRYVIFTSANYSYDKPNFGNYGVAFQDNYSAAGIFAYDLQTKELRLLNSSASTLGMPTGSFSYSSLSPDGNYVLMSTPYAADGSAGPVGSATAFTDGQSSITDFVTARLNLLDLPTSFDNGTSSVDNITNLTTFSLNGLVRPNQSVKLWDAVGTGNAAYTNITATADATGAVTFSLSNVSVAKHTYTLTDSSNNPIVMSLGLQSGASLTVNVVANAMTTPTINAVGTADHVNYTQIQAGVTLTGTAVGASSVVITWGTGTQIATVNSLGNWSSTFSGDGVPLPGTYTVSVKGIDANGYTSQAATRANVVVNATPPGPVTVANINTNNFVDAAGATAGVTVSGTADANSTVKLKWGGQTVVTTADGAGLWMATFSASQVPQDGMTTIAVTATNSLGNPSTAQLTVAVDATAMQVTSAHVVTHNATAITASGLTSTGTTVLGVTADGQYTLFYASDLANLGNTGAAFDNGLTGINTLFAYNNLTGALSVVGHNATLTNGAYLNASHTASITALGLSNNGRYVAFAAPDASKFGNSGTSFTDSAGTTNDILVYELSTGTLQLATHNSVAGNSQANATTPSTLNGFAGNGNYLVFTNANAGSFGNSGTAFSDANSGSADIFAFNVSNGQTSLVNHSSAVGNATVAATNASTADLVNSPSNGQWIVFTNSNAAQLGNTGTAFTDTFTAANDIFAYNLATGNIDLVTHSSQAGNLQTIASAASVVAGVSKDSRYLAFSNQNASQFGYAGTAFADASGLGADYMLYEFATGASRLITHSATAGNNETGLGTGSASGLTMGSDGRYVMFSAANVSNLGNNGQSFVDTDTATNDLVIYNTASGQLSLVSHSADLGNFTSATNAATATGVWGETVVFSANDASKFGNTGVSFLDAGTSVADLFTYNAVSGTINLVTHSARAGNLQSSNLSAVTSGANYVTPDGKYIVFAAGDAGQFGNNGVAFKDATIASTDLFVYEVATGLTRLITHDGTGGSSSSSLAGSASFVGISGDSRYVFLTVADASKLGNNGASFTDSQAAVTDLVAYDLQTGELRLIDASALVMGAAGAGASANVASSANAISTDGNYVNFTVNNLATMGYGPAGAGTAFTDGSTTGTDIVSVRMNLLSLAAADDTGPLFGAGTAVDPASINGGAALHDNVTAKTSFTLNAAVNAGEQVTLMDNGTNTGVTVTANASGNASIALTGVSAGVHYYSLIDTATSKPLTLTPGTTSGALMKVTVQTSAPSVPTINAVQNNLVNGPTKNAGLLLTGSAAGASVVNVTVGTSTLAAIVDSQGNWSARFTGSQIPADGTISITAAAQDLAGNTSPVATLAGVVVSTVAPATPVISTVVGTNNFVNANLKASGFTVRGTADASTAIQLKWGAITKNGTTDSAGNWSFDITTLDMPLDGPATMTVTASTTQGNVASASQTVTMAALGVTNAYMRLATHNSAVGFGTSAETVATTWSATASLGADSQTTVFANANAASFGNAGTSLTDSQAAATDLMYYNGNTGVIQLITHGSTNTSSAATGNAALVSISQNGANVLFSETALTGLANGSTAFADATSTTSTLDYLVYNTSTASLQLVTHNSASLTTNAATTSANGTLTKDGRYVVFTNVNATELGNIGTAFADGDNTKVDIFSYDITTGAQRLINHSGTSDSTSAMTTDAVFTSSYVSPDGKYVAFAAANASQLGNVGGSGAFVESGDATLNDLFVYNMSTGALQLATHTANSATTTKDNVGSAFLGYSGDGKYMLFSNNDISNFGNGTGAFTDSLPAINDIVSYELATGNQELVTHSSVAGNSNSSSLTAASYLASTADGKYAVFSSSDATGYGNNGQAFDDVGLGTLDYFAYNFATQQQTLITHNALPGNTASAASAVSNLALSTDGSWAFFNTGGAGSFGNNGLAFSQAAGTPAATSNLVAYDFSNGQMQLLTHNSNAGNTASSATTATTFNWSDGKVAVFTAADATQFGNSGSAFVDSQPLTNDVFVENLTTGAVQLVSHSSAVGGLVSSGAAATYVGASQNGQYIFFTAADASKFGNAGVAFTDFYTAATDLFAYDTTTNEIRLMDPSATTLNATGASSNVTFGGVSADSSSVYFTTTNLGTMGTYPGNTGGTAFTMGAPVNQVVSMRLNLLSLDAASDTGASNFDNVTSAHNLTIHGMVQASQSVNLFDEWTHSVVATGTANANGVVDFTLRNVATGQHSYSLIDSNNNTLTMGWGLISGSHLTVTVL